MMLYTFDILDVLPYIFLYSICVFFLFLNRKKSSYYIFIILFVFSAIRYKVGYDYPNYLSIIQDNNPDGYSRLEFLPRILIDISRHFNFPQLFFIINSFVFLYPLYYISKKKSYNSTFSMLLILLLPFLYMESLSIVRNTSAYSLSLLGYYFYNDNKKYKAFICLVFAVLFHTSAIIFPIYFFIRKFNINKKTATLMWCVALLIILLPIHNILLALIQNVDFIANNISVKYLSISNPQGRFLSFLIPLCYFPVIYNWDALKKTSSKEYINLGLTGVLLWSFLSFDNTLSLRLSSFFLISWIIIIPDLSKIRRITIRFNTRSIDYYLLFFSILFFLLILVNVISYDASIDSRISFLPYQTIFKTTEYINYQ